MLLKLLGLTALVVIVWLVARQRRVAREEQEAAAQKLAADTTYHAVSIRTGKNSCSAAEAMAGRRFLSNAAPRLPLADCDNENCDCHFAHYKDRRSGRDRRSPFGAGSIGTSSGRFEQERQDSDTDDAES
jgi:hypothetical protein